MYTENKNSIRTKPLHFTDDLDAYNLYRAGLEWDLIDPIVIENRDDLKSEYKWSERGLEPYNHQVTNLITFCRRLPVTLLADDVGLGKTISAGLVASELISRRRLSKILIVCPKILLDQWQEELDTKFGISSVKITGRDLIKAEPPKGKGAIITTYHSARLYLDKITNSGFDMLILDEAHKLRNLYGVKQPPQVARCFRRALAERRFKYVLMLTATPIQNRLWDLYSLVDLLTVARGHENPFGDEDMFARRFIADSRTEARRLIPKMKDEFRNIVYGYMSRVRRGDAKLHFPKRVVQLHEVNPSKEEIELINIVAKHIQDLNRLTQIGILKALVSSPEALVVQLRGMAERKTAPVQLYKDVQGVVDRISTTAKLEGLGMLVKNLKKENPVNWRVLIFTTRRETQTSIHNRLKKEGIKCGLINGDSGSKNKDTLAGFRKEKPDIHVIISTEAGSEGINLQVANVLVNFDLPWNPMIVEQRIGRIQRLASNHDKVCIFNIVLKGTFEDYIVGRLIEKLQMAAHAIGDIEALLQASGMDEGDDEGSSGFEDKIVDLVLKSMAGNNVEEATRKAAQSISDAKIQLEKEGKNIDDMLGSMDRYNTGPRSPRLPESIKSMDAQGFATAALKNFPTNKTSNINTFYTPGNPDFERLVSRTVSKGLHYVEDIDKDSNDIASKASLEWVDSFGGIFNRTEIKEKEHCFNGTALVKVRATVAHDSYERLVEVRCSEDDHHNVDNKTNFKLAQINDPSLIGIVDSHIIKKAQSDPGIEEFCRFYLERLKYELKAAGDDPRKLKKIEDDFTPRLEFTLVGLRGNMYRRLKNKVSYNLGPEIYTSDLLITPSKNEIIPPKMVACSETNKIVPEECLGKCEMSGLRALSYLLTRSDVSGRTALPKYTTVSSYNGKVILNDEVERSSVSGKTAHRQEFVFCAETNKPLLHSEAEKCEMTGKLVVPGLLEKCSISGKNVLPSELGKSAVTGKKALKKFFISSSISGAYLLEEEAIHSVDGKFCAPVEAKICLWSGQQCHPDDLRTCDLTGVPSHFRFMTSNIRLEPLVNLLGGVSRKADKPEIWSLIEADASRILGNKNCRVKQTCLSQDGQHLAVTMEMRTFMGFKIRHLGLFYSVQDKAVVGRIARGKRETNGWIQN
ncbi:MAG: SNF2-related protein [Patescibacteria group bacterium]